MQTICRSVITGLALLAVVGASGCRKSSGLVGTWRTEQPGPRGATVITIEFRPDGTETQRIELGGRMVEIQARYRAKNNVIVHTLEGASRDGAAIQRPTQTVSYGYKLEGDTLTLLQADGKPEMVLERIR